METLKQTLTAIVLSCISLTAFAQTDALHKAFSESYTQEYNKKYGDAINSLTKVYQENSYELNLRLGWLHYSNKNYSASKSYYEKAVALKQYSIEAKLGLVKPLAALEAWDKVLQQYEEVLKIDVQNYTANYWTGVTWYNRKKYEQAARYFERIINLYPFDYDANHLLGWTYYFLGRSKDARVVFNMALLNRPDDASAKEGLGLLK